MAVASQPQSRQEPELAPSQGAPGAGRITWRCLLIGLAFIPVNCWWVGMVEGVWHGLHFTCLSLPMNAVFILLLLILLNEGVRRWRLGVALAHAVLITIFVIRSTSTS